ncbi:MAG: hypothetical protein ACLFVS_05485 [Candidatus Acetothermia bacterium]
MEGVTYVSMYDHWSTCAMTSLEIAMGYCGFETSIPTLMNFDWQYGATLVESDGHPLLLPGQSSRLTE